MQAGGWRTHARGVVEVEYKDGREKSRRQEHEPHVGLAYLVSPHINERGRHDYLRKTQQRHPLIPDQAFDDSATYIRRDRKPRVCHIDNAAVLYTRFKEGLEHILVRQKLAALAYSKETNGGSTNILPSKVEA